MDQAALIWDPIWPTTTLGTLTRSTRCASRCRVELMEAFGLLAAGDVVAPRPATENELLLVHSSGYIEAVREASDWALGLQAGHGAGHRGQPDLPRHARRRGADLRSLDRRRSKRCSPDGGRARSRSPAACTTRTGSGRPASPSTTTRRWQSRSPGAAGRTSRSSTSTSTRTTATACRKRSPARPR